MTLTGLAASPGYAKGPVVLFQRQAPEISNRQISPEEEATEAVRFLDGRKAYEDHLTSLMTEARKRGDEHLANVLDGHLELLLDDEVEHDILSLIQTGHQVAERAAEMVFDAIITEMGNIEDPYARERAADFRDLKGKLIATIVGSPLGTGLELHKPSILVGVDLSPSDTAALDKSLLLGIISEAGGVTSHVAIISQSLGIPAVVAAKGATGLLHDGDHVLLSGSEGTVIKDPSPAELSQHEQNVLEFRKQRVLLESLRDVEARTADGVLVRLYANIGSEQDVEAALHQGAAGIGLFRTEFLFMERTSFPSEEDQFKVYRKVAGKMNGKCVIIRTLDIGGDKPLPYFAFPKEDNPFLGWRATRIYSEYPEVLITQLRAILRASHYGTLKIMFPMIISTEETVRLMKVLNDTKQELLDRNSPFDPSIEAGIMIETPAAVMMADELIKLVDFFSIGSNDLTQYTLAVDRGNEKVASLYDHLHPAVLRQIRVVVDAAHAQGKWAGVCGELAGDERATEILLRLGVDELSMSPQKIQRIKQVVIGTNLSPQINK